jgi:RNA polymerase sigma-70 factor (ECF subfamily)
MAGNAARAYFTNYAKVDHWRPVPGWLDGREVLAVIAGHEATQPSYFIELAWSEGRVVSIRDFRYVRYIGDDANFTSLG